MGVVSGAIRTALVATILCVSGPGRAETAADRLTRWQPFIVEASARFGIPEAWIRAVMQAESGGRTWMNGQPNVSKAGALGLMQVMPETYAEMRVAHGFGPDPHDPRDNILAGTAYLRAMLDRFGYPGLFAAYNAGPGRYERHLATDEALPGETIAYLATLETQSLPGLKSAAQTASASRLKAVDLAAGASLFFIRNGASASARQATPFIPLRSASH